MINIADRVTASQEPLLQAAAQEIEAILFWQSLQSLASNLWAWKYFRVQDELGCARLIP